MRTEADLVEAAQLLRRLAEMVRAGTIVGAPWEAVWLDGAAEGVEAIEELQE